VLTVADRGIGIPAEDMPRLFETFHRARNVRNISGTGLGLAIVKRAVELHGGTMEVESMVGEGTRFSVRLPRVENGRHGHGLDADE
jgi:signal transduction histidine kinase